MGLVYQWRGEGGGDTELWGSFGDGEIVIIPLFLYLLILGFPFFFLLAFAALGQIGIMTKGFPLYIYVAFSPWVLISVPVNVRRGTLLVLARVYKEIGVLADGREKGMWWVEDMDVDTDVLFLGCSLRLGPWRGLSLLGKSGLLS